MKFSSPRSAFILPEPDAGLKQHSALLRGKIVQRIRDSGPMSFHDYMETALYEPGLGYYSAGMEKLGTDGDFITAPELGPLFARCLARTIAAAAEWLGPYSVLEAGAGNGTLAADLLDALAANPPRTYLMLERSADLAARQKSVLEARHRHGKTELQWLDAPPAEFTGVIIANEVVDAMAVERFELADGAIRQCTVGERGGELTGSTRPAPEGLATRVQQVLPEGLLAEGSGYRSELNPHLGPWLGAITRGLQAGLVVISDYGYPRSEYYHPQRSDGTLQCHYRHRAHNDTLFWPGLQDITASVDFSALAEAGQAAGLDLLAYTSQSGFLIDAGLMDAIDDPEALTEQARLAQAGQIKRLALPGEMGERFQFMLMGRGLPDDLPGMNGPDYRYRL